MVKCEKCGQEISSPKGKWINFEKLKIDVNFNQEQNNKEFKDIVIPKGCRLLRIGELKEVMNYIVENKLDIWSYFEQPIKSFEGRYVARFVANSDGANLLCNWGHRGSNAELGVVFCRDVK